MRHRKAFTICPLAGALLGWVLLHPYAMLVYTLMHHWLNGGSPTTPGNVASRAFALFGPMMFPMGVSFAVFGGIIGLMTGLHVEKQGKMRASEQEARVKRVALDTLHEVVVTLSHYLLNANMIIGGKVRHCRKITADPEVLAALDVIEEQGRKIDAVVSALRESKEITVSSYTSDGIVKMIDLEKEIERRMKEKKTSTEVE